MLILKEIILYALIEIFIFILALSFHSLSFSMFDKIQRELQASVEPYWDQISTQLLHSASLNSRFLYQFNDNLKVFE